MDGRPRTKGRMRRGDIQGERRGTQEFKRVWWDDEFRRRGNSRSSFPAVRTMLLGPWVEREECTTLRQAGGATHSLLAHAPRRERLATDSASFPVHSQHVCGGEKRGRQGSQWGLGPPSRDASSQSAVCVRESGTQLHSTGHTSRTHGEQPVLKICVLCCLAVFSNERWAPVLLPLAGCSASTLPDVLQKLAHPASEYPTMPAVKEEKNPKIFCTIEKKKRQHGRAGTWSICNVGQLRQQREESGLASAIV
ncbi:hypothetical protein B0T21DRAFT_418891 [Apiosordaria backusii]|uniref:Uncharacterized protein n=1 Tax=Apiosordaria backusii TaxID=314023 RepID=A0AA40K6J2_9PEZI|nr:hypothetical protein B0T21DRAFT_418891 [Apiosordaria backusii]